MPLRRGWRILGLGLYKDFTPTALVNMTIEVKVSMLFLNIDGLETAI